MDRGGTVEKSGSSPSAIVGCAKAMSASRKYESSDKIAVCTAITSPAFVPIIVKPRMRLSSDQGLHEAPCLIDRLGSPEQSSSGFSQRAHGCLGAALRFHLVPRGRV